MPVRHYCRNVQGRPSPACATPRLIPQLGSKERQLHFGSAASNDNVKGWAAAELEPVYARARELCAQICDPALAFPALWGQWVIRWWKLELHTALELADELLAAAEDAKDPA